MRPQAGVVPLALEALEALDIRHIGGREAAHCRDQERRGEGLSVFVCTVQRLVIVIERGRGDLGVQPDIALEVELVGDEVQIFRISGCSG
jgi:hypothetical protein